MVNKQVLRSKQFVAQIEQGTSYVSVQFELPRKGLVSSIHILGHSMKIPVPYFRIKGLELPGQNLFRNVTFKGFVPNTGCYLNQRFTVTTKIRYWNLLQKHLHPLQPAYTLHVTLGKALPFTRDVCRHLQNICAHLHTR